LKINLFKKGRKNFFEVWKAISMEANEAIKKEEEEIYRW
jgi:cytochrome c551/c552